MSVEVVTKDDLEAFRLRLLEDFRNSLTEWKPQNSSPLKGLKTKHVRRILDCSYGKVMSLRISGKLRCKKIGGTVYYNKEDVQKLLPNGNVDQFMVK